MSKELVRVHKAKLHNRRVELWWSDKAKMYCVRFKLLVPAETRKDRIRLTEINLTADAFLALVKLKDRVDGVPLKATWNYLIATDAGSENFDQL